MAIVINRVMGLTEERKLEQKYGVSDLHISWREDVAGQRQSDPNGQVHLAPLVTWGRDGVTCRYVPELRFRIEFRPLSSVLRQFGLEAEQYFVIDAVELSRDIGGKLATLGRVHHHSGS